MERPAPPVFEEPAVALAAAQLPVVVETPEEFVTTLVDTPLQIGPEIRVTDVVGMTIGQAGAILDPATDPLEQCKTTRRGFVKVVVKADANRTALTVDPSSTLDAATRLCVLKALSVIDIDQVLQPSGSPSEATPRVESQLIISW